VSFLGPAIAGVITGSIVVESVFGLPGIGRYFLTGALNRDYTMVIGNHRSVRWSDGVVQSTGRSVLCMDRSTGAPGMMHLAHRVSGNRHCDGCCAIAAR
jgi:hypothetical protein